ncbi:hypothetical protein ACI8AV_17880 [Geodermatophilus sp. SYSU D00804]
MDEERREDTGLLPLRVAVILILATCLGAAAGVLTYLEARSLPAALLAAGAAWGGAFTVLLKLIGS